MLNASLTHQPLRFTLPQQKQRFGQVSTQLVQEAQQTLKPLVHVAPITKRLDPVNLFETTWNQAKIVYALCIASRIGIGFQRSHHKDGKNIWEKLGNETCEVLRRDPWGWLFWFYAADFTQRLYTQAFVPKQYKAQLLHYPDASKPAWFRHNPLHWNQATPKQLRERHAFMLKQDPIYAQRMHALDEAKHTLGVLKQQKASKTLIQEAKQTFATLSKAHPSLEVAAKYGDLVGLAGIVTAIALNGIGIPVTNILITKRNVKKKAAEQQQWSSPPRTTPMAGDTPVKASLPPVVSAPSLTMSPSSKSAFLQTSSFSTLPSAVPQAK
ncbi:MAG: hypothetical protein ACKO37_10275 [Vampirovibrionales bacterium]